MTEQWEPPFTGNGFAGAADDIIPEYRITETALREGVEVWEVLDSGTQRLIAVLRGTGWALQGSP